MKLEESCDKGYCDECDSLEYLWELGLNDGYVHTKLCKKCLLQLLKLIVER